VPSQILIQTFKDVTVVTFEERTLIDSQEIERIGLQVQHLVEKQDRRKLVIDLSKVQHLSSAALSVLTRVRRSIENANGELILCGLKTDVSKVFKITGLHKLFTFADDESAALTELGVIIE
jgi:anti-sigma B factor antagonist